MIKVREIYVSWRSGDGSRRKLVGVLKRSANKGITFQYLSEDGKEAEKEGFEGYSGFPLDYSAIYKERDLDIFSLRLVPLERKESSKILHFWEAEGVTDKFELLALTQGLLPTDNYEFLGLFYPKKGFKFVSDIAGLSHFKIESGLIKVGDVLDYKIESHKHAFKKKAVKLIWQTTEIGYIKNVHNNIFLESNKKLNVSVKQIEENGIVKNIFITIDSTF
ncbi:MAG: hypothetical protein MUE96_00680 [Bacteroidia bacterium]|jgi:hypothetical protein|nr:hypothetical protein [Bacteroidia bacterium]